MILSARLKAGNYQQSQRIQYANIETANGIQNISSIQNSGVFTCEHNGIYQISVYITTNTHQSRCFVYKNGYRFAEAFVSFGSYYQTGTTTFVTSMNVGNTFEIVAYPALYVYGDYESGVTITQIH